MPTAGYSDPNPCSGHMLQPSQRLVELEKHLQWVEITISSLYFEPHLLVGAQTGRMWNSNRDHLS